MKVGKFLFHEDYLGWMIPHGHGDDNWPAKGEAWEKVLDPDLSSTNRMQLEFIRSGEIVRIRPTDAASEKEAIWISLSALSKFANEVMSQSDRH